MPQDYLNNTGILTQQVLMKQLQEGIPPSSPPDKVEDPQTPEDQEEREAVNDREEGSSSPRPITKDSESKFKNFCLVFFFSSVFY